MKRTAAAFLALAVTAGFAGSALAAPSGPQLHGKPLYDQWAKLELVKTTGMQRGAGIR